MCTLEGFEWVHVYFEVSIVVAASIIIAQFLTGKYIFPSPAPDEGPNPQPTQQPSFPSALSPEPASRPTSRSTPVPGGGPSKQPTSQRHGGKCAWLTVLHHHKVPCKLKIAKRTISLFSYYFFTLFRLSNL